MLQLTCIIDVELFVLMDRILIPVLAGIRFLSKGWHMYKGHISYVMSVWFCTVFILFRCIFIHVFLFCLPQACRSLFVNKYWIDLNELTYTFYKDIYLFILKEWTKKCLCEMYEYGSSIDK